MVINFLFVFFMILSSICYSVMYIVVSSLYDDWFFVILVRRLLICR